MSVTIGAEQQALAMRHSKGDLPLLVESLAASSTDVCVDCGRTLGDFFGSFQWGLVNGSGECGNCGFPYVYYHRQEIEPGETLVLCAFVPGVPIPEKEASDG